MWSWLFCVPYQCGLHFSSSEHLLNTTWISSLPVSWKPLINLWVRFATRNTASFISGSLIRHGISTCVTPADPDHRAWHGRQGCYSFPGSQNQAMLQVDAWHLTHLQYSCIIMMPLLSFACWQVWPLAQGSFRAEADGNGQCFGALAPGAGVSPDQLRLWALLHRSHCSVRHFCWGQHQTHCLLGVSQILPAEFLVRCCSHGLALSILLWHNSAILIYPICTVVHWFFFCHIQGLLVVLQGYYVMLLMETFFRLWPVGMRIVRSLPIQYILRYLTLHLQYCVIPYMKNHDLAIESRH